MPELLGVPHPAPGRALGAVPLLRPRGDGADRLPVVPRRLPAPERLRHRAGGRGGAGGPARRPASTGSTATAPAGAAPSPQTLAAFEAGEIDILVGTQMIAKGHDFPRVTLVGVVDADVGLGLPDFRSAERTFQLLTQVAGRAGPRRDSRARSILQSHRPDHYALGLACAQDYDGVLRARDGVPADHGLPAGGRARERHRARRRRRRRGRRRPRPWPARCGPGAAGATACSAPPAPRSPACAASTASRSC